MTPNNELFLEHVGETKSLILSSNRLEVSNENWYFESVKLNQGISKQLYGNSKTTPKGWYYEVQIHSEGIMQIGKNYCHCVKLKIFLDCLYAIQYYFDCCGVC